MNIPIPLIPVDVNISWRPEKKEESKTPPALLVIDRDFLLTVALFIVLYGALITITGMTLAHAAKS
jgi:hypothetical protein